MVFECEAATDVVIDLLPTHNSELEKENKLYFLCVQCSFSLSFFSFFNLYIGTRIINENDMFIR